MTISTQLNARAMLADYEQATAVEKLCVGEVVDQMLDTFSRHGFHAANDDRLVEVEAVIFNYLRESN